MPLPHDNFQGRGAGGSGVGDPANISFHSQYNYYGFTTSTNPLGGNNPYVFAVSDDETVVYCGDYSDTNIFGFYMLTAGDLSTINTYGSTNVSSYDNTTGKMGGVFVDSGNKFQYRIWSNVEFKLLSLSTPYDLTTVTNIVTSDDLSSPLGSGNTTYGFNMSENGKVITTGNGSSTSSGVAWLNSSSAFASSTSNWIQPSQSPITSFGGSEHYSFVMSKSGEYIASVNENSGVIYFWKMTTPFSLHTASAYSSYIITDDSKNRRITHLNWAGNDTAIYTMSQRGGDNTKRYWTKYSLV